MSNLGTSLGNYPRREAVKIADNADTSQDGGGHIPDGLIQNGPFKTSFVSH